MRIGVQDVGSKRRRRLREMMTCLQAVVAWSRNRHGRTNRSVKYVFHASKQVQRGSPKERENYAINGRLRRQ